MGYLNCVNFCIFGRCIFILIFRYKVSAVRLDYDETALVNRMNYGWPRIVSAPLEPSKRYLLFEYDQGGLNNLRIGWEMAGLVAQATDRTLVLPPDMPMYLIDIIVQGKTSKPATTRSSIADFIDLPRLQATYPTVTFNQFLERERMDLGIPKEIKDDGGLGFWRVWQNYTRSTFDQIPGSGNCDMNKYISAAGSRVLLARARDGKPEQRLFSCGDWPSMGESRFTYKSKKWHPPQEAMLMLKNSFMWHPEAYKYAAKIVSKLGLFNYTAFHLRYNDFQFDMKRQGSDEVVDKWMSLLQEGGNLALSNSAGADLKAHSTFERVAPFVNPGDKIYISTDETDPAFFEAFRKRGLDVLKWDDFEEAVSDMSVRRLSQIKGIIEQLVCTYGRIFIGTPLSTFTGGIWRMRVYADAPHKERLSHMEPAKINQRTRIHKEIAAWNARGGAFAFQPQNPALASLEYAIKAFQPDISQ